MPFVNRIALLCVLSLFMPMAVLAGSLDDPGSPTTEGGGAMNTLEDIYNLINEGTTNAPRTGTFTEPTAGPASTGHTLTEIYNRAKTSSRPAKTGQTTCYETDTTQTPCLNTGSWPGQDAYWSGQGVGVTWPVPRFSEPSTPDGTVTDNLTGLIWLKNANCFGSKVWATALTDCKGLNSTECGLTDGSLEGDWRLPNRFELESLLDLGHQNPALPTGHPFTNVQNTGTYWSSTTNIANKTNAWSVYLFTGDVGSDSAGLMHYVWPVRGGH